MSEKKTSQKPTPLLNDEQQAAVIQYFTDNPKKQNLSRKDSPIQYNGTNVTIPYSIIKIENQYYALYRAYRRLRNKDKPQIIPPSLLKDRQRTNTERNFGQEIGYLGMGRNGIVKRCQNIETKEDAAVKIPFESLNDNSLKEEFYGEAQRQQQAGQYVAHTTLVKKQTNKQTNKTKGYLITPIILGKDLSQLQEQKSYLQKQTVVNQLTIARNILEATKELHTRGLIHLDLGAQNIMLNPENNTVTIMDFGHSVIKKPEQDYAVSYPFYLSTGETHYCPMELRQNFNLLTKKGYPQQVTNKADIYSLGYLFKTHFENLFTEHPEISKVFKELTTQMFTKQPTKRPTIEYCIETINLCLLLAYLKQSDVENAKALLGLITKDTINKARNLLKTNLAAGILTNLLQESTTTPLIPQPTRPHSTRLNLTENLQKSELKPVPKADNQAKTLKQPTQPHTTQENPTAAILPQQRLTLDTKLQDISDNFSSTQPITQNKSKNTSLTIPSLDLTKKPHQLPKIEKVENHLDNTKKITELELKQRHIMKQWNNFHNSLYAELQDNTPNTTQQVQKHSEARTNGTPDLLDLLDLLDSLPQEKDKEQEADKTPKKPEQPIISKKRRPRRKGSQQ